MIVSLELQSLVERNPQLLRCALFDTNTNFDATAL
jgi:hypothetical protein